SRAVVSLLLAAEQPKVTTPLNALKQWVKPEKSTVKDISEVMILEQFLRMVNPELEVWIQERAPKSAEEAASLAEVQSSEEKG
ncbi:putative SCAN domain-containing protein SCAND2P, partial [Micropterus dolomieu]|uniref:putative SCAN domain-containing protein SCAND2P n=1 Tax=Micropterus dolomieu TaxID=147949 RepID=UPI001E8CA427